MYLHVYDANGAIKYTSDMNLTGEVTSIGNAALLGSFTKAALDTAVSDGNVKYVGDAPTSHAHTHASTTGQGTDDHHAKSHAHDGADGSGTVVFGDLTSKPTTMAGYGISDTKTNFNTALNDGSFIFENDPPTGHSIAFHDTDATGAELTALTTAIDASAATGTEITITDTLTTFGGALTCGALTATTGVFSGNVTVPTSGSLEFTIEETGVGTDWSFQGIAGTGLNLNEKGTAARVTFHETSGDVEILTGNLVIGTSGKGIDYTAAGGVVQKQYKEGLHTAAVTLSGSGTYTVATANDQTAYTKVGRAVHYQGKINVNAESSPVGNIRLSTPYAISSLTETADDAIVTATMFSHGGSLTSISGILVPGQAYIEFVNRDTNGGLTAITAALVDADFWIDFSFTFITDTI